MNISTGTTYITPTPGMGGPRDVATMLASELHAVRDLLAGRMIDGSITLAESVRLADAARELERRGK